MSQIKNQIQVTFDSSVNVAHVTSQSLELVPLGRDKLNLQQVKSAKNHW